MNVNNEKENENENEKSRLEIPPTFQNLDLDIQLARALEKAEAPLNHKEFMQQWNTPQRTVLLDTVKIKIRKDSIPLRQALLTSIGQTKAEAAEKRRLTTAKWREAKKRDPAFVEYERKRKRQNYDLKVASKIRRATIVPAIALAAKRAKYAARQSEMPTGSPIESPTESLQSENVPIEFSTVNDNVSTEHVHDSGGDDSGGDDGSSHS